MNFIVSLMDAEWNGFVLSDRALRFCMKAMLSAQLCIASPGSFRINASPIKMNAQSLRHLSKSDPVMRRLIRAHGPCGLEPETRRSPFQSLAQAIAHQQLNGTAANTILGRF